jgi:hypothetical protein
MIGMTSLKEDQPGEIAHSSKSSMKVCVPARSRVPLPSQMLGPPLLLPLLVLLAPPLLVLLALLLLLLPPALLLLLPPPLVLVLLPPLPLLLAVPLLAPLLVPLPPVLPPPVLPPLVLPLPVLPLPVLLPKDPPLPLLVLPAPSPLPPSSPPASGESAELPAHATPEHTDAITRRAGATLAGTRNVSRLIAGELNEAPDLGNANRSSNSIFT